MKNIKFLIAVLAGFISACDVEDQFPSKVVDVTFPTITLKGDSAVSIAVGTPYTDAGATLTDDLTGAVSDITAEDAELVDVNTPGLYMVTYRAANTNGFETIKQRPVAVTNVDPSWDLSGDYLRAGFPATLTEVANGLYYNDNIGGSSLVYPGYMAQLDDSTITVPPQVIPDATVLDGVEETLYVDSGVVLGFSYAVDNPSFGTQVRLFEKQ